MSVRAEPNLARRLAERKVRVEGAVENDRIKDILSWILPMLLLFGIRAFFARRICRETGHRRTYDNRKEQSESLR